MTRRMLWWVLDAQRQPVGVYDPMAWAVWASHQSEFPVAVGRIETEDFFVSTVFLGVDHNYGRGPPTLFETMAFDRTGKPVATVRYSSWSDAEAGHAAMVRRMKKAVAK